MHAPISSARHLDPQILEALAAGSHQPIESIERLYLSELALLEQQARIRVYLPLIALRRVRQALRGKPTAQTRSTAGGN